MKKWPHDHGPKGLELFPMEAKKQELLKFFKLSENLRQTVG